MNGYVLLHRKIVDWEWYTDVNTKTLFLHLILLANHKDKQWRGKTIKRGELVTSRGTLAEQTGLSVQQVRTSLKKLQSTNDITIKTTNKNTLIMVVKYDFYQSDKPTKKEISTNNQPTEQPSNNHQVTTNNNDNKNNKLYIVPIIDYLNTLADKKYTYKNKEFNKLILGRIHDGYTVEQLKEVIKKKCDDWIGTQYEKYLTPTTLFRPSNFETYLNAKETKHKANTTSDVYKGMVKY